MNETEALMVLNAIAGLGSVRIRHLMEHFGSASAVLSAGREDFLAQNLIPQSVVENIFKFPKKEFLEKEDGYLRKQGAHVVSFQDQSYPKILLEISDPPVVLYVKGDICNLGALNLGIVGSRQSSLYGMNTAKQFAQRLAQFGWSIISGMARGIDTSAHEGTLQAHGITVAVLGCGLNHIYPLENERLMVKILEKGAVISEFQMDTPPRAQNFPRRNRLISGLSLGVLVVEAAAKSGALITADCALEQGRDVFALPGKIDSPTSQGVHNLIKQGAKLVSSVEDILEEFENEMREYLVNSRATLKQGVNLTRHRQEIAQNPFVARKIKPQLFGEGTKLSDQEKSVYNCITDRPMHLDELSINSGLGVSALAGILFQLEIKRFIKQLPGKMFIRP